MSDTTHFGAVRPTGDATMNGQTEIYVVRFTGPGGFVFHKVGITGRSVAERFGWAPNGYAYRQLRRYVFETRDEAQRIEQRLLHHFRNQRPYRGLWNQGPLPSGNTEVIVAPENAILAVADRLAGYRASPPTPATFAPAATPPAHWQRYHRPRRTGRGTVPRWSLTLLVALAAVFAWIPAPATPRSEDREAAASARWDSLQAQSPNAGSPARLPPATWSVNTQGAATSWDGTLQVRCSPLRGEYAGILVDVNVGGTLGDKLVDGGRVLVDGREVARGPLATNILARRQGADLAQALSAGSRAQVLLGDGRRVDVDLRGSAQAIAKVTAGCS